MTDRLMLRPTEAAEALGVSRSKTYQLLASGELPSVRLGGCIRVPVRALHDWIARQVTPPTGRRAGEPHTDDGDAR